MLVTNLSVSQGLADAVNELEEDKNLSAAVLAVPVVAFLAPKRNS